MVKISLYMYHQERSLVVMEHIIIKHMNIHMDMVQLLRLPHQQIQMAI